MNKLSKQECINYGIKYIEKHNNYPVSKKWNITTAGCSRDRIYENWPSWSDFIIELRNLKDIGPYEPTKRPTLKTSSIITEDKYCLNCKSLFHSYNKNAKYCSKLCATKSPNLGGYRENSGKSKTGYCEGIYCGSTYELAWVIYNLDHNISFSRFDGYIIYDSDRKYFPDFIQNNTIIEIKGYWQPNVDKKAEAALNAGYDIKILYKKDLMYCFNYIKEEYNVPIHTLFDNYKPIFQYCCDFCGNTFTTDIRRKTNKKYCSAHCSMKGNRS